MILNFINQCRCKNVGRIYAFRKQLRTIPTIKNVLRQPVQHLHTTNMTTNDGMNIFDRKTKTHHKNLAALRPDHAVYDYLRDEIADRVADRLCDILRFFPKALDLGAGKGYLSKYVTKDEIGKLYQLESSAEMLNLSQPSEVETENFIGDEELLPFEEEYFDLVVSCLSMHWINDLPGVLYQINRCLKKDGAFIGAIFGSDRTLFELRCSLQLAEIEREGGIGQHISPFTDLRDIGSLLQRAGMTLTTLDSDDIIIDYPTMFELMDDLKGMGENNCSWRRKKILHRETMLAASAVYKEMYGNDDGSIPATFRVLYMIGWKKGEGQAKPLERGSATTNFRDLENFVNELKDNKE